MFEHHRGEPPLCIGAENVCDTIREDPQCMVKCLCCLTCSAGGTMPGFILLSDEYNFGTCLSRLQDRHSPDCEFIFRPGNRLQQVEHLVTSSVTGSSASWNELKGD